MHSRIFILLFAIFCAANGAITFYANSWLGSIGDPRIASEAYQAQSSNAWTFLWVSFVILVLFSLYLTWKSAIKWAVCFAMGYFVVFSLCILYSDSMYKQFLSANALTPSDTLLNPFFVALTFLVVTLALIAAYAITSNLRIKIKVGKAPPEEDSAKKE